MMKTPLQVAMENLEASSSHPAYARLKQEDFEQRYPDKALKLAELINEMVRRALAIMEGVE